MLIAVYPLVFVVLGLLLYLLSTDQKRSAIGLWVFVASFLVLMLTLAHTTLRIGS